jgi:hypothetical protein
MPSTLIAPQACACWYRSNLLLCNRAASRRQAPTLRRAGPAGTPAAAGPARRPGTAAAPAAPPHGTAAHVTQLLSCTQSAACDEQPSERASGWLALSCLTCIHERSRPSRMLISQYAERSMQREVCREKRSVNGTAAHACCKCAAGLTWVRSSSAALAAPPPPAPPDAEADLSMTAVSNSARPAAACIRHRQEELAGPASCRRRARTHRTQHGAASSGSEWAWRASGVHAQT